MRYSTLLLDADDTVLDFDRTEESALRHAFEEFGLPYDSERHAFYHALNRELWHEFAMGRMDKATLTVRRFELLFEKFGIASDPAAFKACYESWIAKGFYTVEGAEEVLCRLKKEGFFLCCVTNGLKSTQHRRLAGAGLDRYFDRVFISEEAGSQKPQKAYFDYVFGRIPEHDPARILLVGDSLAVDIGGGRNAGIRSVWFNPRGEAGDGINIPDYEIRRLDELFDILHEAAQNG